MSQKWNQRGKVTRSATWERAGPRACCGKDHKCGAATGETHFCTYMGRLCVHAYAGPNSKYPDLRMHKNRIKPICAGLVHVRTVCVDVAVKALVACKCHWWLEVSVQRVCTCTWGLHAQPPRELDLGTGNCSSLALSHRDGRNPPWSTRWPPTCALS